MSYWCGFNSGNVESINMTSNVSPQWRLAGADLAEMDGKPACEVKLMLATAVRNMLSEPEKYRALDPENGWGDFDSTVKYLVDLALMAGKVDPGDTFYAHH